MSEITVKTVDEWLNSVSYEEDPDYVPSDFALEFVNFIKLVNGGQGEENNTPVLHYKMLDKAAGPSKRIANMIHRGAAKALALDTQVPTPLGNVCLRDLRVGDEIFYREGKVTEIIHKSEVFYKPMYLLELEDGRTLKVSEG